MKKDEHNKKLKAQLLAYKENVLDNSLTQQAYIVILTAIKNLLLEPEESFLEREIAELLEMSRTPVHEALVRLEMDEWLETIPRKGIKVAPILKENIIQISQITEVLEGLAVQCATDVIKEEILDTLELLIVQQEEYMYKNNLEAYVTVDHQFHNLIISQSYNERLIKLMESYSDQLYRARLYTINKRKIPVLSIQEHRAILASMRAKNGIAARELMQAHRHRGSQEMIKIIEEMS